MSDRNKQAAADPVTRERMIQKVGDLIKDIKMAMLTTEAEDGVLRSRPMATQNSPFDGTLWFFTSTSSGKIGELDWNPEVNLSYAEPSDNKYVSLSGNGEIVRDRARMRELWSDMYKAWFPQGLNDPDVCLLKVEVSTAEYWEAKSGKMLRLCGNGKASAAREYAPGGEPGATEIQAESTKAAAAGRSAAADIESHT